MGLAKHTFTFSSSLFDVSSDIVNSLNFIGYYNPITDNQTSTTANNGSEACSNSTDEESREDVIWGIVSMIIVFLPGIFTGIALTIEEIYN